MSIESINHEGRIFNPSAETVNNANVSGTHRPQSFVSPVPLS